MEIKNNPVGRLHNILREANAHKETSITQDVWMAVLDAPHGDMGSLLRLIAEVIHLQEQAKQALKEWVEGDQTIYLAPFHKLDQVFAKIDLSSRWSHSKQYLDETTLSALAFGSHLLESKYGTYQLTAEQTIEFIEKLEQLMRDCMNSNLPEPLQKLFHTNLDSLRQALIRYKISGIEGLEAEVDRVIGAMSRYSADIRDQTDETSKGFMKSVFEIIANLNESIQLAETAVKLTGPSFIALLPLLQ
ncbi:hypothetical protein DQ397_000722 [Pseudomonas sp. CK-NBRI-02]|uniref:hypothetical protein n=1 Tax=Pseudomonas sp. CK-NBRI-02 TaxID=2249759 RepID=UPI0005B942A5|nr:hypothetical protein [Pseudomonas sp. CK-NBRI-02]TYO83640.1 hypothetical protein DQ397_000722 [Pseudomonas sp. CK-NBRI-02]